MPVSFSKPEIVSGAVYSAQLLSLIHIYAARVRQDLAFGDADAGLVRLELVFVQELHRVRGHHRQSGLGRQAHGGLGVRFVAVHAGALQFDVVAAREQVRPLARQRQRRHRVAGVQRLADVAAAAARQHDQAVLALQPFTADLGAALALVGQELSLIHI